MNARMRFWGGKRLWRREAGSSQPVAPPKLGTGGVSRTDRPARLLFINQYYWPDTASTAQHLADLAESLVEEGHEVHVLCSRGGYKPGSRPLPAHETQRGVQIHRVTATSLGRRSSLSRMVDYLSFYAEAAWQAMVLPRFDMVATLTTPPLIGLLGTILRRRHGSQHVYWSMDLHPDASLALGRMSAANPVVRVLQWLSNIAYRSADRVVVLGSYMGDRVVSKGVRPNRMVEIPVWSRSDEIYPCEREGHMLRERLGLSGKFVAMYSGNLGLAHSFEEFLEAARRLRDQPEFVFLYVGGGPRLKEIREAKQQQGLDNIRILDYFPREELHASLSLADVHLISMRAEMTGLVVPSKLYGAMASARPALFVGPAHCETADTIRRADCGIAVRLGDPSGVVDALLSFRDKLEDADRMGERGREYFLTEYERLRCCYRWGELVAELVGRTGTETSVERDAIAVSNARSTTVFPGRTRSGSGVGAERWSSRFPIVKDRTTPQVELGVHAP